MHQEVTLFISMFTTLLAIINPLEALPVFLKLLEGKDDEYQRQVARRACLYAMLLAFFFLFFGNLILWIFGVPLSMVRIVGGIILMHIGFRLFAPSSPEASSTGQGKVQVGPSVVAGYLTKEFFLGVFPRSGSPSVAPPLGPTRASSTSSPSRRSSSATAGTLGTRAIS